MSGGRLPQIRELANGGNWRRVGAITLLMAASLAAGKTAATPSCSGAWTLAQLQSHYEVVSVEKFRGGLTSRKDAERAVGVEVTVLADVFRFDEDVIDRPVYDLDCYPVPTTEGEIDSHRWSNFYGLRTDRRFIEVLSVYESESAERPSYRFEVISADELWRLFDGWVFKLRRSSG